MKTKVIGLMTDWGRDDGAFGSCQGVIWGINPEVQIADMSQNVASWDIKQGALLLMVHYSAYPRGTIFVSIIDPGVGTERKEILIETNNYFFVGPNNGVMSWALNWASQRKIEVIKKVIHITNTKYFRWPVSTAFEGRDVFCSVAAWLSRGIPVEKFGKEIETRHIVKTPYPLEATMDQIIGEVLFIDRFGNLISSINKGTFFAVFPQGSDFQIQVGGATIEKFSRTYADGKKTGELLAFFGGDFGDLMDIAVYKDSAEKNLGVTVGARVIVKRR